MREFATAILLRDDDDLTCGECSLLLPEFVFIELTPGSANDLDADLLAQLPDIRRHLTICPHCHQEYLQLQALVGVVYRGEGFAFGQGRVAAVDDTALPASAKSVSQRRSGVRRRVVWRKLLGWIFPVGFPPPLVWAAASACVVAALIAVRTLFTVWHPTDLTLAGLILAPTRSIAPAPSESAANVSTPVPSQVALSTLSDETAANAMYRLDLDPAARMEATSTLAATGELTSPAELSGEVAMLAAPSLPTPVLTVAPILAEGVPTPTMAASISAGAAAIAVPYFTTQTWRGWLEDRGRSDLAALPITVRWEGDTLLIEGEVEYAEQRAALEAEAKQAPGVTAVSVEKLQLVPPQTYTVREGDSLWAIAMRIYGSPDQVEALYIANSDRLSSPSDLPVGMVLNVPPAP